jgi:hypothetical protein
VVARILRRIQRKVEDVLGEGNLGCRRGTGSGDAIWMLRITTE